MKKQVIKLFGILTALFIADFFITKAYLAKVGIYGEANPVMRDVVRHFGIFGILYAKLIALLIMGTVIIFAWAKYQASIRRILLAINISMTCIVFWSLFCFWKWG
jgi:hypothetical protein